MDTIGQRIMWSFSTAFHDRKIEYDLQSNEEAVVFTSLPSQ